MRSWPRGCGSCAVCVRGDENLCAKPRFLGVHCDRRLLRSHHRAASERPDRARRARSGERGTLRVLGGDDYGALRKLLDVYPAEPIVVIGAGGLGLMCLSILKALGGKGAVVVDIDERKRRAALECGALAAVDSKDPHVITEIPRAAQGPVRGVVDLVGSPETAALGFDLLPKGGKLVIVGLFGGGAPWALPLIPIKAATIQGSYVGNLQELRELVELARTGAVPAIPITRRPLEEAGAALEDLREGKFSAAALCSHRRRQPSRSFFAQVCRRDPQASQIPAERHELSGGDYLNAPLSEAWPWGDVRPLVSGRLARVLDEPPPSGSRASGARRNIASPQDLRSPRWDQGPAPARAAGRPHRDVPTLARSGLVRRARLRACAAFDR